MKKCAIIKNIMKRCVSGRMKLCFVQSDVALFAGKQTISEERKKKMAKDMNLQDVFLNQSRKERIPVTIYITNGFQFKGIVKGFDNYTVILDSDGRQNLIYKHAISTITPIRPISLLDAFEKEDKENG